jgi:hypothetical protein
MLDTAGQSSQALLSCLRYDFPTEWAVFVGGGAGAESKTTITRDLFPYAGQGVRKLTIDALTLYAANGEAIVPSTPSTVDLATVSSELSSTAASSTITLQTDNVLTQ